MFENKKFGTMGKGGDIHNDNICNDDVCDNSEAECEDWRKWVWRLEEVEGSENVLRDLEEGCNIRIEKLRQMMDVMVVEKHVGLTFEGGRREKLRNIHFVALFSHWYFYISNRVNFKWTKGRTISNIKDKWLKWKFLKDKKSNWTKKRD